MSFIPITLFVVFIGPVKSIGWVASSRVYTDIILNTSTTKLQCSMLQVKRATNKVPLYAKTFILS